MPAPFLKWAGGKGQILPELRKRVAQARPFRRYHEPFVGGGALFFDLFRAGGLGEQQTCLSDNNTRLIEAYQGVRDHVEHVIARLLEHQAAHDKEYYYAIRAEEPESLVEKAARIIYLNRTCFNGLYRENSRGKFNVPMGRYKDPMICDAANLRAVSKALRSCKIGAWPFETIVDRAEPGDLVYFDPPYHPLSTTSSFTAYHQGGFGEADQRRLAEVMRALDAKGVSVLLSNSTAPLILELYENDFRVERVLATRNVNSKADGRGKIEELLVRNY